MSGLFTLSRVSLLREGRHILRDVSWTVREGERWVVLGPNGAGKTTLVRILSSYLVASTGTVDIFGCRVGRTDLAELRPQLGYLSAAIAHEIPESLTPRQIVGAAQAGALVPWYVDPSVMSDARTDEALAQVGMTGAPERPIASFSSGEQLRVQLARALVARPRALLLDEPMASLDIGGRAQLVASLERIASGPIGAIVLVLHRLEDVPVGFTHALLLRDGAVLACGAIDEVLSDEPLSACFDAPLRITRLGGRYTSSVAASRTPHR